MALAKSANAAPQKLERRVSQRRNLTPAPPGNIAAAPWLSQRGKTPASQPIPSASGDEMTFETSSSSEQKRQNFNTARYGISRRIRSSPRRQSALHFLDRCRHRLLFQRPALHREWLAAAEGRGADRGDDQLFQLRLSAAERRHAVLGQPRCRFLSVGCRAIGWSGSD